VTTIGYQLLVQLKWLEKIDLKAMPSFPKFVLCINLGIMVNQIILFLVDKLWNYKLVVKYAVKLPGAIKHLICNLVPLIATVLLLNPEVPTIMMLCALILTKISLNLCGLGSDEPPADINKTELDIDNQSLKDACEELEKKIEDIQNRVENGDCTILMEDEAVMKDEEATDEVDEEKTENTKDSENENCLIST
jgi:hypothetical protein